jgi:glycosyltransferase involved in cell wall biosynthesis
MPFGFCRRIVAGNYDLVHVHHSYCGWVATRQRKVPVVWTFHEGEIMDNNELARSDDPAKRIAYSSGFKRRVARRVNAVIVVAEFLKEPLRRFDAITLPAGIDMDRFVPTDSAGACHALGLAPEKRYILFPSAPSRIEKRYELARAAVDDLRLNTPGNEDVELISLDNVPHDRVPLYMNASELMLMTSAFEASPVTVREALACNVPVISTDIGDARVILEGIEGCRIVEPDPAFIAAALGQALSSPRRVAGRERMQAYSTEATARRLVEVYREVLGQ